MEGVKLNEDRAAEVINAVTDQIIGGAIEVQGSLDLDCWSRLIRLV